MVFQKDSVKSHDKFINKHNLTIDLVSDEECKTLEAYGSWVEKSMYGRKYMGADRSTFIIDPEGKLVSIYRKVKVAGHVEKIFLKKSNLFLQKRINYIIPLS